MTTSTSIPVTASDTPPNVLELNHTFLHMLMVIADTENSQPIKKIYQQFQTNWKPATAC